MIRFNAVVLLRQGQYLLEHLTLQAASPGILWWVGTGGTGKSSFLAALAGQESDKLSLRGDITLNGKVFPSPLVTTAYIPQRFELADDARPVMAQLLALKQRLLPSQVLGWLEAMGIDNPRAAANGKAAALPAAVRRTLAVLTMLEGDADVWLLDEPTAGLDDAQIALVRDAIARTAQRGMVIAATHNRQDCLHLGGHVALCAGGRLQEAAPAAKFFSHPATPAGQTYVETGNCNLPRPSKYTPNASGIWWVFPQLLGGMSRPGMVCALDEQLQSLHQQGTRVLINLEERNFYRYQPIQAYGIDVHHFPIPDMAAPTFAQAVDICRLAEPLINANHGVVMHCRGGLGRTGTALASILIWYGETAQNAITIIRDKEPKAIQSNAQLNFLQDFADRIRGWRPTPAGSNLARSIQYVSR
ncbi:MAG: ATP-binding cassette domain-containing protein [Pseudomonadota bacterium]|nr:ATP-binding cassette domain-containing protein [Pseudomonadota bacterium]